jgi:hypothetical protein
MIDRKSVLPRSLLALTLWSLCVTAVAANLRAGAARVDITPAVDAANIPDDASFGAYTFQVLSSRLKPGCAETAIDGGLMNLLVANDK